MDRDLSSYVWLSESPRDVIVLELLNLSLGIFELRHSQLNNPALFGVVDGSND